MPFFPIPGPEIKIPGKITGAHFNMKTELESFKGKCIVLDTRSSWIYIGILEKVTDDVILLSEADAHDNRDTSTTKELYIYESRKTGLRSNRSRVYVDPAQVIGFCLLEDIKQF